MPSTGWFKVERDLWTDVGQLTAQLGQLEGWRTSEAMHLTRGLLDDSEPLPSCHPQSREQHGKPVAPGLPGSSGRQTRCPWASLPDGKAKPRAERTRGFGG